jgi:hypothetical protein
MSKQLLIATIALATALSLTPLDSVHAELPGTLQVGDAKLVLNGSGARTKYLMKMYVAGLYLTQPSAKPAAIIADQAPMAIRLEITSGLVTQEKLVESLNEGFDKATSGKPEPICKEIDQFRRCFAQEIAKGDVFDLVYLPEYGVTVLKNGKRQGVVPGLAFKKALFGIWLSDDPVDKDLKSAMLLAQSNGGRTASK